MKKRRGNSSLKRNPGKFIFKDSAKLWLIVERNDHKYQLVAKKDPPGSLGQDSSSSTIPVFSSSRVFIVKMTLKD
jgi:hypothetical protein